MKTYQTKKFALGPFIGGWNLRDSIFKVGRNQIVDGSNVMISDSGLLIRRPGLVRYDKGVLGSANGYGLYKAYKSDGTSMFLKAGGNAIWYSDTGDGNRWKPLSTDADLNITADQRVRFAVYNDVVYMTNGSNRMMKWDFNTAHAIGMAGITEPAAAPTLAANTSGSMEEGTYYYKTKYYNSVYGTESPFSPVSNAISVSAPNDGVTVTIPTDAATEAQVDKVRIYRTLKNGATTDSFYYVGEVAYSGTETTFADTLADASLGVAGDTDTDQPPTGPAYILSSDNMIFLGGFSATPNRLYYSRIGYPEYFTEPTTGGMRYLNVGRAEGDRIRGMIAKAGKVYVFKDSSIWALDNPVSPEEVQLRVVSSAYGLVAPDTLCQDEKYIYFVSFDGLCVMDVNEEIHVISGMIDPLFKGVQENSIPRSVLQSATAICHERKLLLSYSSKRQSTTGAATIRISEAIATTGNNRATASLDSDGAAASLQAVDAVYSLMQTQSAQNNWLEIRLSVPWDTSKIYQGVEYKLFVSHDNRATWIEKISTTQFFSKLGESNESGAPIYLTSPQRDYVHRLYESGVTDIRLDLVRSWQDADKFGEQVNGPTTLTLKSVAYYWDTTSVDAVNDRTICFYTNRITYNPLTKEILMICTPPWNFGTRAFCVAGGGSDHNELYMASPDTSRVFQIVENEVSDDGVKFLSWYRTGNVDLNQLCLVDRIKVLRFPGEGQATFEVYLDAKEAIQQTVRFAGSQQFYGDVQYLQGHYGNAEAIVDDGPEFNSDAEGRFLGLRVWSEDGNFADIIEMNVFVRPIPEAY